MVLAIQFSHTSSIEDEIAALSLQMEEISVREESSKGKHRADTIPDLELAYRSYREELQTRLLILGDIRMAHSMACAVDTDGQVIAEAIESEEQARVDRHYATSLDNQQAAVGIGSTTLNITQKNLAQQIITTASTWEKDKDGGVEAIAGPSMAYAERQARSLDQLAEEHHCEVCLTYFRATDLVSLPCGMRYCKDDLQGLFVRATTDETLYPPRCCGEPIPLELIQTELSADELQAFQEAVVEFTTSNRTYCSNAYCGKFVPPIHVTNERAVCRSCNMDTCTLCKQEYHYGGDCPEDISLQATLTLANEQGWQRCNSCHAMVELEYGCNHMTYETQWRDSSTVLISLRCKCGAQFCYLCGRQWKTCPCDQWNEGRLLRRAREVVEREAPRRLPRIEVNRRVEQMRHELEENHECRHRGWLPRVERNGTRGRFTCEICARQYSLFILQCPRCHVHICADCKRHRIR